MENLPSVSEKNGGDSTSDATGPREPTMKTGPCGILCTICRFYISGQCPGHTEEDLGKAASSPCPVVQCASACNITFCARDCQDFPCLLLERTIPYRWSRLALQDSDASLWRSSGSLQDQVNQDSETLRVFCLGQFRVFRGAVEVQDCHWGSGKGPTQKIKALFAFLLCKRDQGARKETLIDLLWSRQTDPKRASSSFHQALFYLRRALEPELKVGAASSYIRCQGDRYFFSPLKPCWIDADVFAAYVERAQALEPGGDPDAAIAYWSRAIALYGGNYMAGIDPKYSRCHVHDWCIARCHQLRQFYLAGSMTVARHEFNLKHHGLAVEYARQALSVEPALEPAHFLLMQCLLETGHLDSAIGQYHSCKAELAQHEDRAPSEQTQMLYQRLLDNLHLD